MGFMNGGAPVILQLRNFGNTNAPAPSIGERFPAGLADAAAEGRYNNQGGVYATRHNAQKFDAVMMLVCYSCDIVVRTGSCEVRE